MSGDEELFAAFMDWWWFEPLVDGCEIGTPTPHDMASCVDDFQSMLAHLRAKGFTITRETQEATR